MYELALFAGAGGGILGGKLLGWRTVCAVENDPYAISILIQRQNDGILAPFPIWDNICTFDGRNWRGRIDVVSGGFPCQAYSTAAAGKNISDDLWPEMRRIVADVAPRYVFAENVSQKAIDAACDDLEEMGYKSRALAIGAQHLGADHSRTRYWAFAYADDEGELCGGLNAEMAVSEEFCQSIWETSPMEPRVANGMAYRMDRFKATGNGQIPAVVRAAWQILKRASG